MGRDSDPLPSLNSNNKQSSSDNQEAVSVLSENLKVPWSLAFLPNGRIIVTERSGRVRIIDQTGNLSPPIVISEVKQSGEGGLHGVAVDPQFETNNNIFLYFTYAANGNNTLNRVVRYNLQNDKLTEEKIIVDGIPGAVFHDGGRIKFGPDGFLYITTGDALEPSLAQNKNSLAGKILRVTRDGTRAPGNPFTDAQGKPFEQLVYSYGHRNPQGLAWDDSGRLFETEHGNNATDEVNIIVKGGNYGWPTITGSQTKSGMQSPLAQSGEETWAPAGAAFLEGSIFFAGLRGSTLYEYNIANKQLAEHFKDEFGRIRDVVLGPDNFLYITISNRDGRGTPKPNDDKILKINPAVL